MLGGGVARKEKGRKIFLICVNKNKLKAAVFCVKRQPHIHITRLALHITRLALHQFYLLLCNILACQEGHIERLDDQN